MARYDSAAALIVHCGRAARRPPADHGAPARRAARRVPGPDCGASATDDVPAYRAYQRRRAELVAAERDRLRLDEYRPKVMTAFVRNRLLDEVYLPLIGDNLARQLGADRRAKRTDQTGLLLLISPPGYGKTTLMEYVASRLGLIFVKVNGPALGHGRHVARPGRGAERHRPAGGREDLLRAGDGQQRAALPRRHPAHRTRTAPEVHLAVRRAAPHGGRLERPHPHLRPARQAVRGVHGRQPVHRDRASGSASPTCSPTAPTSGTSATC